MPNVFSINSIVCFHKPEFLVKIAPLAACAAAIAAIAGCAAAGPYAADGLSADQLAQVGETCRSVMGLQPGEAHYVGCVESLSDSSRDLDHGLAVARARGDCLDRGLRPNTPDLAECTLRIAETEPATAIRASRLAEERAPKSYFMTSPRDVHRREALSCARLGFDPASGAFATCVAGLQANMFAADNPMN